MAWRPTLMGILLFSSLLPTTGVSGVDHISVVEANIRSNGLTLDIKVDDGKAGVDSERLARQTIWVAVPPNCRRVEVTPSRPGLAAFAIDCGQLPVVRGMGLFPLAIDTLLQGSTAMSVEITHDGTWRAAESGPGRFGRSLDAAVRAGVVGLPRPALTTESGSYVIVTAPQYASAVEPLAAWKTRKGLPVITVTTDETGTSRAAIKAWLQDAYDTWQRPPEYILLVGDVDDVPTWEYSNDVSDLPYGLLDGDDWLPDALVGRFSVENQSQASTMVNKTVSYERDPFVAETNWFTRGVYVAGQYASTTPMHAVRFCGEQLESIGFDPLDPVIPIPDDEGNFIVSPYQPREGIGIPQHYGPNVIKASIDEGCSFVVYRGWAYGTAGWQPPTYTVDDIPALANGQMLPVVMSFVCLNGDFSASEACFGEVFTTVGEPDGPYKGAIAFYGSGEHWVHTRYNDAMAIATFECVTDPAIPDLGSLLLAGKLRFLDYFPHQLDCAGGEEECAELYFHTYNLLGDPELNYVRAEPTSLQVSHPQAINASANYFEIAVLDGQTMMPCAECRIGAVQAGVLVGSAFTDASGMATVLLSSLSGEADIDVTVTDPRHLPYEGSIVLQSGSEFVSPAAVTWDDAGSQSQGNGDGVVNPGETHEVGMLLHNDGEAPATMVTAGFISEDLVVLDGQAACPDIPPGGDVVLGSPFVVHVPAATRDGAVMTGLLHVDHQGGASDSSLVSVTVAAPALTAAGITIVSGGDGDQHFDPGEQCEFSLTLYNAGSVSTSGFSTLAQLAPGSPATMIASEAFYGPVEPAETVVNDDEPFAILLDDAVPLGAVIPFTLTVVTEEGYLGEAAFQLQVGANDSTAVTGPDTYGYYAIDSHDRQHPTLQPEFVWQEISSQYGGPGTQLFFDFDNYPTDLTVDLPFDFSFYGEVFQSIRICDNGWIAFDTDDAYDFYNYPIPSRYGNGALVAPFWDELTPISESPADSVDGVYYWFDAATNEFIVEWNRLRHIYDQEPVSLRSFQVVLRDPAIYPTPTGDGEILFYYRDVTDDDAMRNFATIGIESPDELTGLQYRFAGIAAPGGAAPGPGFAVRLTTEIPAYVPVAAPEHHAVDWRILGVHPNPFNPRTTVVFAAGQPQRMRIGVYDVRGRLLVDLADEVYTAGRHEVTWTGCDADGRAVASGVYIVRIQGERKSETRRLVLVK